MTGISNLNIVVQQGSSAAEALHVKQQSAEHTQTVAAQEQAARTDEANRQVQGGQGTEKPYLNREKSGKKKREASPAGRGEKRKKKKGEKTPLESTGKLLDTVA